MKNKTKNYSPLEESNYDYMMANLLKNVKLSFEFEFNWYKLDSFFNKWGFKGLREEKTQKE